MVATIFTLATIHSYNNNNYNSRGRQQPDIRHRPADLQQQPHHIQQHQNLSSNVLTSYLHIRRSCVNMVLLIITMITSSITNLAINIPKLVEIKIATSLVTERPSTNSHLRVTGLSSWEAKARFMQKSLVQSRTGKMVQRSSATMLTI